MEIAFQVERPCITVLFGKSGAGKTTLAKILAGLVQPDRGRIAYQGNTFFDSRTGTALAPERRGIGYLFQEHRLFPHLKVKHNLSFGRSFGGRKNGISVDQVVDLLGIGYLLDRYPGTLSGGESQRVALGRALLGCTSFLLMDEPLSSLHQELRQDLLAYIGTLPREFSLPLIYITHDRREVLQLADHVLLMNEGKVIAAGEPAAVMTLAVAGNHETQ